MPYPLAPKADNAGESVQRGEPAQQESEADTLFLGRVLIVLFLADAAWSFIWLSAAGWSQRNCGPTGAGCDEPRTILVILIWAGPQLLFLPFMLAVSVALALTRAKR